MSFNCSPMDFLIAPRHRWIYVAVFSVMAISAFEIFQNLNNLKVSSNLYLNLFLNLCKFSSQVVFVLCFYLSSPPPLHLPLSLSPSPSLSPSTSPSLLQSFGLFLRSFSYHCCFFHCLVVLMLLSLYWVMSWDSSTLFSGKLHIMYIMQHYDHNADYALPPSHTYEV